MSSMSCSEVPGLSVAAVPAISARATGLWLAGAAITFWVAWALMPGVGITDTREIFARVAANGAAVRASVILQLVSAVCYAPALLGLATLGRSRSVFVGAALLLVGAMGSTADAVLHLLAVEMVAPGVDRLAMIPVMERMQGPDLRLLGPLLASFFVGSSVLAVALARRRIVARGNPALIAMGVLCAFAAAAVAGVAPLAARALGLGLLGCVAASQAWIGARLPRLQD